MRPCRRIRQHRPDRTARVGRVARAARAARPARGPLGQYPFEIGPPDPHPPPNPQRRQRALIDPVADRLLVQLEDPGHLGDGQERVRCVTLIHAKSFLIETNWSQFRGIYYRSWRTETATVWRKRSANAVQKDRDGVETEGPTTEHGGEEPGTTNNVVPFPRDWLGPREELIPFGSSAGYGVDETAAAPGAEAFWGGDSGPLHAVLPEPVAAAGAARSTPSDARRPAGGWRAGRGGSGGRGVRQARWSSNQRESVRGLRRRGGGLYGPGAAARRRRGTGDRVVEARQLIVSPRAELVPLRACGAVPLPAHGRPAAVRLRRRQSPSTTVAAAPTASTSQTVSSTGSSSSASEPAATSSAPTHSSVSSHTANVRPGPVGPGAPFGPGQLK